MNRPLPSDEPLVPVHRAVAPRIGRPHRSTLIRWIVRGVRLRDGTTVRLPAWRFGSRWVTTPRLASAFVDAVTTGIDGGDQLPPRTSAARERASREAEEVLRRLGM
jgi:hypothetical protein